MRILSEHPSQIVFSEVLPRVLQTCPECSGRTGGSLIGIHLRLLSFLKIGPSYFREYIISLNDIFVYPTRAAANVAARQVKPAAREVTAYSQTIPYPSLHRMAPGETLVLYRTRVFTNN